MTFRGKVTITEYMSLYRKITSNHAYGEDGKTRSRQSPEFCCETNGEDGKPTILSESLPLCVDLDGTLVRTDTLFETIIAAMRRLYLLSRMPLWLVQGKIKFKANLALGAKVDATLLPYNEPLLEYLREQKGVGRHLVLATAANERIAHEVNRHLKIFDEIIASDDSRNLRGARKARALVECFGSRGFCYIGNDRFDLPIWECASSGILVNVSDRVAKKAANLTLIEQRFSDKGHQAFILLKALRPHQWLKNLLVFVPIITSGAFGHFSAILHACIMFAAFCCIASGIYVINDLYDLDSDRQHPSKRKRPLASGALSLKLGLGIVPVLIAAGVAFAGILPSPWTLFFLLCYGFISIAYSVKLKKFPLIDVFTLAGLYTLRLFAGGEATGYHVSLWLMAFSGFIFLALAIVKRTSELTALTKLGKLQAAGRSYTTDDILVLKMFGIASTFVSSLVIALYVNDQATKAMYAHAQVLWLLVPLILLWQCRIWLATERGYMHDDPIVYAGRDWVSWLIGFFAVAVAVTAGIRW